MSWVSPSLAYFTVGCSRAVGHALCVEMSAGCGGGARSVHHLPHCVLLTFCRSCLCCLLETSEWAMKDELDQSITSFAMGSPVCCSRVVVVRVCAVC